MTRRILAITRAFSGQTVAAVLRQFLRSWSSARRLIRAGEVLLDGKPCRNPARVVRRGQQLEFPMQPDQPKTEKTKKSIAPAGKSTGKKFKSGPPLPQPIIRFADSHVVVVDKPAGLTTVRHKEESHEFGNRAQRYLPPTLVDLLPALVDRGKPGRHGRIRAVHRLDKETSGLLVLARTDAAESNLGKQMRAHSAGRKYLALVRGHPQSGRIESRLIRDRGDGRRGSTDRSGEGKRAVTKVSVLGQFGDFALVECELETGRTHQVRVHLGERGTPLCGERVYDRAIHGAPLPDSSGAARPMLHAGYLQFTHPATGRRMTWTAPPPADMKALLKRLRRTQRKGKRL
jgi:23S rRNA pseudouridine1911/1915/1917 synthase